MLCGMLQPKKDEKLHCKKLHVYDAQGHSFPPFLLYWQDIRWKDRQVPA